MMIVVTALSNRDGEERSFQALKAWAKPVWRVGIRKLVEQDRCVR